MQRLRRLSLSLKGLPKRQTWHNLSAFTQTNIDMNAWKELRTRDSYVQNVIDKVTKSKAPEDIDWPKWQSSINHTNIVECLKGFYDNQMKLIESLASEDHNRMVKAQTNGWNLYEEAISSCQKSVEYSEGLVSNGARALWVSYNNPPIWKIDTNEWVESDLYWQAYIEKHHFYNPNPTSNDPELPAEIESSKKTWHTKVGTFNDRSNTSILYCYMEHLPSWEYYDLHRRAFLEHMTYYLTLTGGNYRFFPELPPWQWLTDIEKYRYQFISVVHRRRAKMQLDNLEKERGLDLQPSDYAHDGEEFHTKLINSEARAYEMMVGRMMGNFLFLTHPFIPFQTQTGYKSAINTDGGKGNVYSLGEDDHMALTGKKFTPAYATIFDIFVDIVSKRPAEWFNTSDEIFADAFLRRMSKEEAFYPVFEHYVEEMKSKFQNAQMMTDPEAVFNTINNMEDMLEKENTFYEQLYFTMNPDFAEEFQQKKEFFTELFKTDQLQTLIESNSLAASPTKSAKQEASSAQSIMQDMAQAEQDQSQMTEFMKAIKMGTLEQALKK